MSSKSANETFRRYTDVLSMMDMLHHKRLTLTSPSRWFDQNDSFGLELYSKRLGEGSVYALCLAGAAETAHHWQLFAGHSHGICVQIDKSGLIAHLNELPGTIVHGPALYRNLAEIRKMAPIETNQLPFLKRNTFKAEDEYRVVAWQNEFFASDTYTIPLPINLVQTITFGPTTPRTLAETLKDIACREDECANIRFTISKLTNNESWREALIEGARI